MLSKIKNIKKPILTGIAAVAAAVAGILVIFVCEEWGVNTPSINDTTIVQTESVTEAVATAQTDNASSTQIIDTTVGTEILTEVLTTEVSTTKKKTTPAATEAPETETKFIDADLSKWINPSGTTTPTRFNVPEGFVRVSYKEGTYAHFVQNLPLEYYGRKMYEYDGEEVENQTWCASVIKTNFPNNPWLQCADCVMKLIGDYLFSERKYSSIEFDLVTEETLNFSTYANGNLTYSKYTEFMDEVYYSAYTTTLKAQDESKRLSLDDIFPGAYFIMDKDKKHKYGHAIFVIDVAKNPDTGEIAFLLAQGSTPSQDMHIFTNPLHINDPWYYSSEIGSSFEIPFWTFTTANLYYYDAIGIQRGSIGVENNTTDPEETVPDWTEEASSSEDETTSMADTDSTTSPTEDTSETETIDSTSTEGTEETGITTGQETSEDETTTVSD